MATSAVSSTTSANAAAMSTSTSSTSGTSTTSAQAASKAAAQKIVTSLSAGSGVDVNALAQNLVDAERIPRQNAIQSKIDKNNARVSGLSAVMFMLNDLKTKMSAIKDKSSLSALTATSSTPSLTATAAPGAAVGSHDIQINKLATAQRSVSAGFASESSSLNGGAPFKIMVSRPGIPTGDAGSSSAGASQAIANGMAISDVVLGGASDFSQFQVTVDGVVHSYTPSSGLSSLADLASDLQAKISADASLAGHDLVVQVDPTHPAQLNITSATHAVTAASLAPGAHVSSVAFGQPPQTSDFKAFSVTIDGVTRTLTPTPASATAAGLATALQSQLRALEGTGDISVEALTNNSTFSLVFKSASGRTIVAPALATDVIDMSPPVGLSGGTPQDPAVGVSTGKSSGASISGVSLGTAANTGNLKAFSVTVGGVTHTLTPDAGGTSLTDLASQLSSKLTALDADLSVRLSGDTLTVVSASGRTVSDARLSATSLDGVSFATNNPTTKDFRGFGLTVGGTNYTLIPSPASTSLTALAADLQSQLRSQAGNNDLSVTTAGGQLRFWSASGSAITNPMLLTNTYELTPAGVARAINDKKLGVTAQVVNTGDSSNPFKLVVSGATGQNQSFKLASSALNLTTISSAADAEVVVDGVSLKRSSNTITDAINGVTLNLKSTTPGGVAPMPAVLDIGLDASSLKTKMTDLVSSFNDNSDLLNQVSNAKSTLEIYGGTLVGDFTVRTVRQTLRSLFSGTSSTPGNEINAFWQLGIKVDERGVMSFDTTTFDKSVRTNYADVVKSLTGNYDNLSTYSKAPAGLAGDAVKKLTDLLAPTGILMTASEGANTQNTKYQDDLAKLQTRMEALLARYQKQFASMDSLVGNTNSQKTSLKSTFEGMMSVYTNK
jgi:flagellar hook-associated protein 2